MKMMAGSSFPSYHMAPTITFSIYLMQQQISAHSRCHTETNMANRPSDTNVALTTQDAGHLMTVNATICDCAVMVGGKFGKM